MNQGAGQWPGLPQPLQPSFGGAGAVSTNLFASSGLPFDGIQNEIILIYFSKFLEYVHLLFLKVSGTETFLYLLFLYNQQSFLLLVSY